jgi:hypothetical protein
MAGFRQHALCGVSLALAVFLLPRTAEADPSRPFILFDNGLELSTNELSFIGKRRPLRALIDDNTATTWVFESLLTATPELRIEIPEGSAPDRLILIGSCAESGALPRLADVPASVSASDAGGAEILRRAPRRSLEPRTIALEDSAASILVRLERSVPGEQPSDSCISGLDLVSGGRSLLRGRPYLTTDGGEYPDYQLFVEGRKVTDFPRDHNMESFFIEDGNYAVFVHWQFPGVTLHNVASGARGVVLQDVLVVWNSLVWRAGRFEGRQMNPPDGPDTAFSRAVALP